MNFSDVFRRSGRTKGWRVGPSDFDPYSNHNLPGGPLLGPVIQRYALLCGRWVTRFTDSPANPLHLVRKLDLLDGSITEEMSPRFPPINGVWVNGENACRFLCYELGIKQPRRWSGELLIPTHEQLVALALRSGSSRASQAGQGSKVSPVIEKVARTTSRQILVCTNQVANPGLPRERGCPDCRHYRKARTGVTTGKVWCELAMKDFPQVCGEFSPN